ncbi:MAG: succinyl-CoA synthetase subunit beta [Pseudomonadota bacterium]
MSGVTFKATACALAMVIAALPGAGAADSTTVALSAFAENCFSPFMTARLASERLPARHDFYDLRPFSASNAVSPAQGRAITPGTDRRCEVAFDGRAVDAGIDAIAGALASEGITSKVDVPEDFALQPGTQFAAARLLNPQRIAVVQVGTRPGPNGVETFLNVERLTPLP